MKSLSLNAISAALLLAVFGVIAQAQTKPNTKATTGQVRGMVTISGKAAAGVLLSVRTNNSGSWTEQSKATTNEEGKYHIGGLATGTYLIAPIAWAFVPTERDFSRSVVIAEDESIENLNFSLVRGAAITGKVTDANGNPVIEETVSLTPVDRSRSFYAGLRFQTDDRGIYRIFGVPAGKFKVSVGQNPYDLGDLRHPPSYRQTFFPGTSDIAKANVIEVAEGTELTNINITVEPTLPGFFVMGQVVDGESGRPLSNIPLHLTRTVRIDANGASSVGGGAGNSDSHGEFRIRDLVPGHYSLSVFPSPGSDLRAEPVVFDIVDQDLTGLRIVTSAGASIEGTVILEGVQDPAVAMKLAQLYLSVDVENGGEDDYAGPAPGVKIMANGAFRVGGLQAGRAAFSLGRTRELRGFTIMRIERDGAVQPNKISIQDGEHLKGVRIIVAYGTASIRGVVKLENGTLPADSRLSVHIRRLGDTQFEQGVGADARGRFVIDSLISGDYELILYLFGPIPSAPRWVKQLVTVSEGEVTEVTVSMDLKQSTVVPPARP